MKPQDSEIKLSFYIHDLNPWGGQDRSTLEIVRRLSHFGQVDICSFTLNDDKSLAWGKQVRHFKIHPKITRPVLVKMAYFQIVSLFRKLWLNWKWGRGHISQSTGTSALFSNWVQVQFVHTAWKQKKPHLRGLSAYHELLLLVNTTLEKLFFTRKKNYIAISSAVKNELMEYFRIPEDKIFVIHHGVDSNHFIPHQKHPEGPSTRSNLRNALNIRPTDTALLLVGAYERKGLSTAISAIAKLPENVKSNVKLLAVGNGNKDRYHNEARNHGVEKQLILMSLQRDIRPYYWASDVFLFPTLYEPFGLVILEAMACGLPSIVSRTAGASELITHDKSGILIDSPENTDEIALKLLATFRATDKNLNLSTNAMETAQARSWDQVASDYHATFSKSIKRPKRHPNSP